MILNRYPLPYRQQLDCVVNDVKSDVKHLVWLKSGNKNDHQGRFEALTWNPMKVFEGKDSIKSGFEFTSNLFDTLSNGNTSPKFEGPVPGIFGVAPYQYGEEIMGINGSLKKPTVKNDYLAGNDSSHKKQLSANGQKNYLNHNDPWVGFYPWLIVNDHLEKKCYLVQLEDKTLFLASYPEISNLEKLLNDNEVSSIASFSVSEFKTTSSKDWYEKSFSKIKNYIAAGDVYQINLTQRFEADFNGEALTAHASLLDQIPTPYSAYMDLGGRKILSHSPERFISIKDGVVESKPIKGTIARGITEVEDNENKQALRASIKDRAENLMIVDLLRNDLGKHAKPGTVKVPKLFDLETFPNVHHLVSTVRCELDDKANEYDMLVDAFPGGSITGAPKKRAMEIIAEIEESSRSYYCGTIFYWGVNGNFDSSILIRTLVIEDGKIYCWGGGGIVFDSELESEYQESLTKVKKLMKALES